MTPEQLEAIIAKNDARQPAAYAALTLTRVLAPEWTHMEKPDPKSPPVTIVKAAGCTFGRREDLEKRLEKLLAELSSPSP
jgi:hypothetical protein